MKTASQAWRETWLSGGRGLEHHWKGSIALANWTSRYWSCLIQFYFSLLSEQQPNGSETVKRHAQPNPLSRAKNTDLLCYWVHPTCNFQHASAKQIVTPRRFCFSSQQCNGALVFESHQKRCTWAVSSETDLQHCWVGFFWGLIASEEKLQALLTLTVRTTAFSSSFKVQNFIESLGKKVSIPIQSWQRKSQNP